MKKQFNNSELCHVFVSQHQNEGTNPNGSLYFYGKRLYSYGYHYLLAEFIENKEGETCIYINDSGYSSTTGKHINLIISASSHYKRYFESYYPRKVLNKLRQLHAKLLKAKKPEIYIEEALSTFDVCERYYNELALNDKENFNQCKDLIKFFTLDTKKLKELQAEKKAKDEQRKKDVKRYRKNFMSFWFNKDDEGQKKVAKLASKKGINLHELKNDEHYLRINGENVETSAGANVSIKEATLLYKLIIAGKDIKGYKIGYYTVISINGTLKVGCHNINIQNMHKVGKQLLTLNK